MVTIGGLNISPSNHAGGSSMDGLVGVVVVLFVSVLLFLIFRAVVLWYWKINVTIELLQSIDAKLDRLPPPHDMRDVPPGITATR
jgi:hypothetical protein